MSQWLVEIFFAELITLKNFFNHGKKAKPGVWAVVYVQHILTSSQPVLVKLFPCESNRLHTSLQVHSSSADCTRELFKPSKDSSSLQWKKKWFWIFCEWCHKWNSFRPFLPNSSHPGFKPRDGSIALKFLLETRLKSESFETLDDLLGFWVQKLWPKNTKISN